MMNFGNCRQAEHSTIVCFLLYIYSTVQYSTVQHSTVQYSTVQYSTVQYSTVQYSTAQYSTVQYSTVRILRRYLVSSATSDQSVHIFIYMIL